MKPAADVSIQEELTKRLINIENHFAADVFSYYGPIMDGNENFILNVIENLAQDPAKKDKIMVILTTPGGSAIAVERYVNILRHHYNEVNFIVPNFAYSAGTIFCMSGDNIYMDYFSTLGPIDPQVPNKEGKWVAALGYLDKVNDMIEKSRNGDLTDAEFLILKSIDLAELRGYEQAKQLTIALLKQWLVKYKFKNWVTHQTTQALLGQPVTHDQKLQRAEEIAGRLSNHAEWFSHGRPINIEKLKELRLTIEDYSKEDQTRNAIRSYYDLFSNYLEKNKIQIFVQTRKFV